MSPPLDRLVADNLDIWTSATARKNGAGRGGGKRVSLYGIERLRALILDLAVRGKLVPQDAGDEPAAALLPKISLERERRVKAGEIKNAKGPYKPSSEPFELPAKWLWLPLWQTGNIFTGNSINSSLRAELETNVQGRPFVATKDVGYGLDSIEYDNGLIVSLDDKRFNVARPNSVFICAEGGSAGRKMAISDREISFGNKLIANEPWSQIEPRFMLYTYLSSFFFECFSKEMTGIIGGISRAKFLELPFPLPPLVEQQRIVAKVDELMALCDALERASAGAMAAHQVLVEELLVTLVNSASPADRAANWSRLQAHFDTLFTTDASIDALKQTILDLAVRGTLVEQDARDETASELLKQLNSDRRQSAAKGRESKPKVFPTILVKDEPYRIADGWHWARVAEIFQVTSGGAIDASLEKEVGAYAYLKVADMNLRENDVVITTSSRFIDPDQKQLRALIQPNSIIFPKRGGAIATNKKRMVTSEVFVDLNIMAIMVPKRFSLEYVYLWLLGIDLALLNTGTSVPQINHQDIDPLPFPIPPLAEQHRIVAKVDTLMALCDQLKARLADAAKFQCHLADAITERAAA